MSVVRNHNMVSDRASVWTFCTGQYRVFLFYNPNSGYTKIICQKGYFSAGRNLSACDNLYCWADGYHGLVDPASCHLGDRSYNRYPYCLRSPSMVPIFPRLEEVRMLDANVFLLLAIFFLAGFIQRRTKVGVIPIVLPIGLPAVCYISGAAIGFMIGQNIMMVFAAVIHLLIAIICLVAARWLPPLPIDK